MAGLVKHREYDWKDSNMALFGSEIERSVKLESAKKEPAWKTAGQKLGLQIWRIVNFKVTTWPAEDYGKFFNGDSYIILNTYHQNPNSRDFSYDLHFWIGSQSTADEYGTAAYKTVELDTYLNDKPVQHREVEGYESELFKSYFKQGIILLNGGAESGFKKVKATEYTPRLLHFHGDKKNVVFKEVPRCKERLDPGDVFILDLGLMLYQWNGSGSNKDERFKALMFLNSIKSERGGLCKSEVLEENGECREFIDALNQQNTNDVFFEDDSQFKSTLFKVSDETGTLKFTKIKENKIDLKDFQSDDVFILDTKKECFVWIGSGSTDNEKKNGIVYAHNHLMKSNHPLVPIVVLKEGQVNKQFTSALAA